MANTIMHFEIPADDVARAKLFYEKTFGWKIKKFPLPPEAGEYYAVMTKKAGEEGINGGLMPRKMAGEPFMNYITVKSIDAVIPAIEANGATVVLPKQEIAPGAGWIAAFRDQENNIVGLHQLPPAMKAAAAKKARPAARKAARKPAKKSAKKKPAKKKSRR